MTEDNAIRPSWEGVGKVEKIVSITVGGEVFVRADWDAYDTGYQACKIDVIRAIAALEEEYVGDEFKQGGMALRVALAAVNVLPQDDPEFTEMGTPRFNHGRKPKFTLGDLTVSLHTEESHD